MNNPFIKTAKSQILNNEKTQAMKDLEDFDIKVNQKDVDEAWNAFVEHHGMSHLKVDVADD